MSGEGVASDDASLEKLMDINDGNGIDGPSWRVRVKWNDNANNPVGDFTAIMFINLTLGGAIHDKLGFTIAMRSSGPLARTRV